MTIIKYTTVGHARKSNSIMLIRGKKTGQVGFRRNEHSDDIFGDPIYAEEVVELPEPMNPTEYDEFVEETLSGDESHPIRSTMREVADEKGVDTSEWSWGGEDGDTNTENE